MSRRASTRPAMERRKKRIRSCTPLCIVEIANVEIERIIEDLEIEVIMYFRLNNLRNLSGICQEKILFRSQSPFPPIVLISPDPATLRAYPSQIQYRPLAAG